MTRQGKGSYVAAVKDAARALAAEEFETQLKGLLDAARKLGLDPRGVVARVEQALAEPGATPSDTDARKPE